MQETIDSLAGQSQSRIQSAEELGSWLEVAPPYLHRVVSDRKAYRDQKGKRWADPTSQAGAAEH